MNMFESYIRQAIDRESCHATLANRAATPLQALYLRLFRHIPWQSLATYGPLYGSCIQRGLLFIQRRVSLSPQSMNMACSFAWGIIETPTIYSYTGSHEQAYNTPFNLLHCAGKNNITTYEVPQLSS
jgi:hypothetical protein